MSTIEKEPLISKSKNSRGKAWKTAEEFGFDMSLVEANLSKPPAERIRQHCEAVEFSLKLRSAVRTARDQS